MGADFFSTAALDRAESRVTIQSNLEPQLDTILLASQAWLTTSPNEV